MAQGHRYVALLRGIAPSGKNMSNAHLRGAVEGLGYADVASVQASGNILFTTDETDVAALERAIDGALAGGLGLKSTAIVRSAGSMGSLAATDPFPGLTHGKGTYLTATFVKDAASVANPPPEPPQLHLTDVVGFDRAHGVLLTVTDNSEPGRTGGFMAWLERAYGKATTTRSWPTVQRLAARLSD